MGVKREMRPQKPINVKDKLIVYVHPPQTTNNNFSNISTIFSAETKIYFSNYDSASNYKIFSKVFSNQQITKINFKLQRIRACSWILLCPMCLSVVKD